MKTTIIAFLCLLAIGAQPVFAHGGHKNVKLHVNPSWKECSFQLHPSLTQEAWHQFTAEAALVIYFRPLIDARPMGGGELRGLNSSMEDEDRRHAVRVE